MPSLFSSRPPVVRRWSARTVVRVSVAFVLLGGPASAAADGHTARLSRGLADAVGRGESRGVIVSGTEQQVRDLAMRHGLTVDKVLGGGAVLRVRSAADLAALAADPAVPVVADDAPVQVVLQVTPQRVVAAGVAAAGADEIDAAARLRLQDVPPTMIAGETAPSSVFAFTAQLDSQTLVWGDRLDRRN